MLDHDTETDPVQAELEAEGDAERQAARAEFLESLTGDFDFPGDLSVSEAQECENRAVDLSPTALKLDDWGLRRGRELLKESNLVRKSLGGKKPANRAERTALENMAADFHAAAFEPDHEFAEHAENPRLKQYMQNLLETPEFQALHAETMLDETSSEYAAASFAKGWVALCEQEPAEGLRGEMQCMRAGMHALDEARQEVQELRNAQDAMWIGHKEIGSVFKRVKGSHQLRKICELAGRYRRLAQAKQRQKVIHGRDDVVGVVLDGDLGRILPHELALLDDPDLELDTLRRIVERQAMCREYRGIEHKAKGPIVVVVDESGSMSGEPIWTAKAIALALAWVAKQQNRFLCLVGFAGATEGNFYVCPPGKVNDAALMDWLEHFFSGGTDCDVPLKELPAKWESLGCPKGRTDIICITDAIVSVPDDVRNQFLAWKQAEQVKMVSMIINSEPGDLAKVSDRIHRVASLSVEEEAVGEALSV